jgi:TrmH family RNA methyltransferase
LVGNEHEGASEEVLRETDVNCRIEMENYDSLNVAIATGIILHRFRI